MNTVGVAVVGCGTVGGAVVDWFVRRNAASADRLRSRLHLRYIIKRQINELPSIDLPDVKRSPDWQAALEDSGVSIVVELMGGTDAAFDLCRTALEKGKHVVTANKALLAERGRELFSIADSNGAVLAFEASCAAGVPIIHTLSNGLLANRIESVYGIINGTCNYILSKMADEEIDYNHALRAAQDNGFAESDASCDVDGSDSAQKIALLSWLSFGLWTNWRDIPRRGIEAVTEDDIAIGKKRGYALKLIAAARRIGSEDDAVDDRADGARGGKDIKIDVAPCFIANDHPFAKVDREQNALLICGAPMQYLFFQGPGAGGNPTASGVIADMLAIESGSMTAATARNWLPLDAFQSSDKQNDGVGAPLPIFAGSYYPRLPGSTIPVIAIPGMHPNNAASKSASLS